MKILKKGLKMKKFMKKLFTLMVCAGIFCGMQLALAEQPTVKQRIAAINLCCYQDALRKHGLTEQDLSFEVWLTLTKNKVDLSAYTKVLPICKKILPFGSDLAKALGFTPTYLAQFLSHEKYSIAHYDDPMPFLLWKALEQQRLLEKYRKEHTQYQISDYANLPIVSSFIMQMHSKTPKLESDQFSSLETALTTTSTVITQIDKQLLKSYRTCVNALLLLFETKQCLLTKKFLDKTNTKSITKETKKKFDSVYKQMKDLYERIDQSLSFTIPLS